MNKQLESERINFNKLLNENNELKQIMFNNEEKYARLCGYVEPIEQEIAFKKDEQPQVIQKYMSTHEGKHNSFKEINGKREYKNSSWQKVLDNKNDNKNEKCHGKGSTTNLKSKTLKDKENNDNNKYNDYKPKNQIKTVFLPNEQLNNLNIEIEILKNQLENDKKHYETEFDFYKVEKERRNNEFNAKKYSDIEKIDWLKKKIDERTKKYHEITKELLQKKSIYKSKELNYINAINNIEKENEILNIQTQEVAKKALNEAENCYRLSELRTEDLTSKFRSQSMRAQEELKRAKQEHDLIQKEMEDKISELENNLQSQIQIYRKLERKRETDMETFIDRVHEIKDKMKYFEENFSRKYGNVINVNEKDKLMTEIKDIKSDILEFQHRIKEAKRDDNVNEY